MKHALIQATQHPQVKAACLTVLSEVTSKGVFGIYDKVMDTLALKIAVYIHNLEKQNKEKE